MFYLLRTWYNILKRQIVASLAIWWLGS